MKKYLIFLIFVFFTSQTMFSQFLYSTDSDSLLFVSKEVTPDTALVNKNNPQKPLWIPLVESVGLNLALGTFNYLMGSEFAKISRATVVHNFERGWSTDADGMITNMFAHPFHGSVYYNLARSSGFNYWTSLGVTAFGSWQWEYFMENEPPAWNDWIMTSYAGSMIGEVFYRLSNLIIDESTVGAERTWREIGAGIFNPGRLFNRLVYGRTSRVTHEQLYKKDRLLGEIAFGGNNVADGVDFSNGEKNGMLTLDLTYGKIFRNKKIKPFDFFRLNFALNFSNQPLIGQLRVYNIFMGKAKTYKNGNALLWGVFGNYDFIQNNVYELGGASIGLGFGYSSPFKKKIHFVTLFNAGPILMGAANSDYAPDYGTEYLDSVRTYNMGPGAMLKSESFLRFSFGSLYLGYSFWWIHTWDGAPGDEYIGMLAPKLRIRVYKKWFVGLEYLLYHRVGKYDDLEDRDYKNNEQRLFIGYAF